MDLSIGSIVKIRGDRSAAKKRKVSGGSFPQHTSASVEQIAQIVKWTNTDISSEFRVAMRFYQLAVVTDGKLEYIVASSDLFEQPTPIERQRFILERARVNPILEPPKTGIGKAIIVN